MKGSYIAPSDLAALLSWRTRVHETKTKVVNTVKASPPPSFSHPELTCSSYGVLQCPLLLHHNTFTSPPYSERSEGRGQTNVTCYQQYKICWAHQFSLNVSPRARTCGTVDGIRYTLSVFDVLRYRSERQFLILEASRYYRKQGDLDRVGATGQLSLSCSLPSS